MKFSAKTFGTLAVASLLSLSLVACTGGATGGNDSGKVAVNVKTVDYTKASYEQLKEGGELRLPIVELTEQGNPFHQDGSAYTNEMWYWYNPQIILFDDQFEPYANPDYVTDVKEEVKDGKTVVTYTINPKAKYNDGTEIDWKAFETTWKINNGQSEDYAPSSTDGYQDIESVERGENDKQVVVTFNKIYSWYYGLFNTVAHPKLADPTFYKEGYLKTAHNELGAGPYIVENYDANAGTMSFVKNPQWWGKPGKLDRVTLIVMEAQAQLNALKNGEIDAITQLAGGIGTKERLDAVKDVPNMKIYTADDNSSSVFMLNSESEVLKDIRVREAIFAARDREQLAKIGLNGLDYQYKMAGSYTLYPTQKGYKDNFSEVVKYDPEHSKKLLDEAGWKVGADGIREKDGVKLALKYPLFGNSATKKAGYQAQQQMLKAVGIDLQIVEYPSKDFSNVYTKRQFDVMSLGFRSSDPFGVAYFGQIYGSESGLNLSGTGTKEFDKKIEDLQKIANKDEQIEAANKLETEAFKLFGIMPGYTAPDMSIVKEGLANVGSMSFHTEPRENIGWVK